MHATDTVSKIETLLRHLERLQQQSAHSPKQSDPFLAEVLQELQNTLEELRQQNEELILTREAAEVERQRYQELFEFAPDGYVVTDAEGVIRQANRATATLLQVSPEGLVNKPLTLFVADGERRAFRELLEQLKKGEGVQGWEVHLQPRRLAPFPAALDVTVARDAGDCPAELRWLLSDITERRLGEQALAQLAAIVESSADAIFSQNLDGRIVSWNASAERLYGYSSRELDGLPVSTLIPPDRGGELAEITARLQRGEHFQSYETVRVRKDGGRVDVSVTISPIRDLGGQITGAAVIARDIAERKRADEALRETSAVLENAVEGIARLDPQGRYLAVNRAYAGMLGYQPEEMTGLAWQETVHPADHDKITAAYRQMCLHGKAEVETRAVRQDSSVFHQQVVLVRAQHGQEVIGHYCFTKDITERKQAEEALAKERTLLRTLIDQLPDYIFIKDAESRFVLNNRAHLAILGAASQSDVAGKTDFDFFSPVLAAQYYADEQEAIRSGRPLIDRVEDTIDRTGHRLCLLTTKVPLRDAGGAVTGIVGISHNITERKQAEAALQQQRDFAESLVETAQAIVLVLDLEGRIRRFNRYMEELSGYRLEEVQGQDWFTLCLREQDRSRVRQILLSTLAGDAITRGVNPIVTRDGRLREIEWSNKVLRDAQGHRVGVLAIGHDVTDLREAQRQALQSERLVAIGQMVAGLAHESRNVLQASQMCLEVLSRKLHDRPEILTLVERLRREQERLHCLYDEVREYAAPIRLDLAPCHLAEVWREAWARLTGPRTGRDAVLQEDCGIVDLLCPVDRFRLEQVFRNILENALAACPDPVRLDIRCSEAEIDGRPAVRIAMRDNGPGFTAEQRQKIFEPFYTTKPKGSGLGMAICKRLVEAHGGQLAVGAGPGPGAEILITLPRTNG